MKTILFHLTLLLATSPINIHAQNNTNSRIDTLLNAIISLQSASNSFYLQGTFTSQRGKHKLKEDNNIFFTSIIAFTLKNNQHNLSENNRKRVDSICDQANNNYNQYQNKTGVFTYNFWQTKPPQFFPNSHFLSRHSYFSIPDDIDVGALVYLTDTSLNSHVMEFKNTMTTHANLEKKKIKNTFRKYRSYKAYSTWIGKKMPIEFDICVLSNALYFVYENNLPLTKNDSASILLIREMILSGQYLKQAYYLSPSYKKSSIVLYHLARLMGNHQISLLDDCREQIKKDIETSLQKSPPFMEHVILSSALLKMGGKPKPLIYPVSLEKEFQKFSFFRANLFSVYARPSLRFVCKSKLFDVPFYSKAYCLALLVEYEALSIEMQ
ncbi:hypothetical protein BH10BAC1_BH10BAC1_17910 [soil metagenome]